MASGNAAVAEALRPVLRPLDVDDDTFESIVEVVAETVEENADLSAAELAPKLEETLEPFLIAFGGEPSGVPTAAMSVAVHLRGFPVEAPAKVAAPVVEEALPKKGDDAPQAATKAKAKAKPKAADLSMSLADKAKAGIDKAKAEAKVAGRTEPVSLGALWTDKIGDAESVWDSAPAPMDKYDWTVTAANLDKEEEAAAAGDGEPMSASDAKKRQQQERRAERVRKAAAVANAAPPTVVEDMDDIALHGLRETQEAAIDGATASDKRVHKEGKGGKNVHLEGVCLTLAGSQGTVELLKDADLHLNAGHVYGMVGKNGSGKTTLMRRMAMKGLQGMPMHLRPGYVAQELPGLQGSKTVLECVVDADEERTALLKEREELDASFVELEGSKDAEVQAAAEVRAKRFTEVEQLLEAIEADGAEDRARDVLSWLNFDEALMNKEVATLSGGWRMRLALAASLCGRPDILYLDEPTNHLDLHGVIWLQEHLRREWGENSKKKDRIVVVVSHDRSFLDACATDILEINDKKLRNWPGNYTNYMERTSDEQRIYLMRKEEDERKEKQAVKELKDMKKKARAHADDKKVRQIKSREKKLEGARDESKLSSQREFGADSGDIITKLREDAGLRFKFPAADVIPDGDTNLVEMDSASVKQAGKTILKNVTVTLEPRSRVALVGSNGAGKSTLMKALAGELKAEEGARGRGRRHAAYAPGFVSQNHLERMAASLQGNCIDYLREHLPDEKEVRGDIMTKQSDESILRAHLGAFGMGKDALKKVGYLSGGQKARLSMAAATWWGPNVLLIDEPTNHLDVDSLDALSLGLQAYEGAVVIVSHNKGFLEALCDELWVLQNGTVKTCPRGEEAFAEYFAEYTRSVRASLR